MSKVNKTHVGSDFDSLLAEDGLLEEASAVALKRVLAWEVAEQMKRQNLSKTEMARRMDTSRSALDRLLDPENASVTLQTLHRAATAVGRRLRLEIV